MSALSVEVPFPVFYDRAGEPLENGYVWIGQANLNPQTNPIQVYFDRALTQPAAQPLRTLAGYVVNAGTPAQLYVDATNFSILVQDKNGTMVYNFPDATGIGPNASGVDYDPGPDSLLFPGGQISVKSALDQITDKDTGSTLVGFNQSGVGAISRTVEAKLREFLVSVKDYGAVGDGVTDDRNAINAAFTEVLSRGYGTVFFPAATYRITGSIGDITNVTNPVAIHVLGEAGTTIECDPAVGMNYGIDLILPDLRYAIVENITIQGNNKVATGIRVTSSSTTERCQLVYINNFRAFDLNVVNDPSVTTGANGIFIGHNNLGINVWVTNSYVANVSRDKPSTCSGITAQDAMTILVQNNAVFNVTHNSQDLRDADGIKIFSFNDGTTYYRQSTCEVSNNRIVNCNGRMIKLQTDGVCVCSGNMMALTSAMELITNWKGVDSQVASATIINNKIKILAQYTGGGSETLFELQCLSGTNIREPNQVFVQRVQDNDIYVANLTSRFTYGVGIGADFAQEVTRYYVIKNNVIGRDTGVNFTQTDAALSRFVRITGTGTLATWKGFMVLDVSDNRVSCLTGAVSMVGTNNEDYADKWFFYVYDNFIYSFQGGSIFVTSGGATPASNIPYTSTMMVRDNSSGNQGRSFVALPLDVAKLLGGAEIEVGDGSTPAMTNVPANYRNGRIKKNGRVIDVQTVSGATAFHYISTDTGANYYAV